MMVTMTTLPFEDHDDDTLYHDADVSLNELHDLHIDAPATAPPGPVPVPPVSSPAIISPSITPPNDASSIDEEERSSLPSDELHPPKQSNPTLHLLI